MLLGCLKHYAVHNSKTVLHILFYQIKLTVNVIFLVKMVNHTLNLDQTYAELKQDSSVGNIYSSD